MSGRRGDSIGDRKIRLQHLFSVLFGETSAGKTEAELLWWDGTSGCRHSARPLNGDRRL